ncbi:MAG TPA: transporter [Polyangia bacterium]|nr:transporter [Polyangia bacterium]
MSRRPWCVSGLAAVAALCLSLPARQARACASCACGDPTLAALGTERPLRNRLRAAVAFSHRALSVGDVGLDELRISEQRVDAHLAWAPHERLFLLASLPGLRREVTYRDGYHRATWGNGDAELRAKLFVFQDRAFAPRHLVAALAGLKLPTAVIDRRPGGAPDSSELQFSTGSVDPILGASYGFFAYPWSAYASGQLLWTREGTGGARASRSVSGTAAVQRHLLTAVAIRLAIDSRLDSQAREGGFPERHSGGFIAFASPEILVSPATDLVVSAWARLAFVNALAGRQQEPFVLGAGVGYDF